MTRYKETEIGQIPEEWELKKLHELGEINRGKSKHRPRYASFLYGGPYPFIQTGDIKASGGRITEFTQTYSEAGLAQSRLWPTGTICITIAANIAETGILSFPACFPDSVIGFIPDLKKCNGQYVEYALRSLKDKIRSQAIGSVQDNINLGTFNRVPIPYPPLKEQNRIAEILSSIDDQIELNREKTKNLQEVWINVFKHWFVDFEFPNKGGNPYRSSGGRMVDSQLGEIPIEWKTGHLSKLSKLTMGLSPKGNSYNEIGEGIPLLNGASDFEGSFINPNKFTSAPTRVCNVDDLIFCIRATIGNIAIAEKQYCLGRGVAALTPINKKHSEFIYFILNQSLDKLASQASGSVIVGLSRPDIENLEIIIPTEEILVKFHNIVADSFIYISNLQNENKKLSEFRDSLLPRFMSGKIRVNNHEISRDYKKA